MSQSQSKPIYIRLPCTKCGYEIKELIEGTTIRCFACQTENNFLEAKEKLEKLAIDMFGQVPSIDFIEDPSTRKQTRITRENKLGNKFSELEGKYMDQFGKVPVIATPLEQYPLSKEDVLKLANEYNSVAILLKNYVFPLALNEAEQKNSMQMYYFCVCRAMILIGSYHTILASNAQDNNQAWNLYSLAAQNFEKLTEFAKDALAENIEDDRFDTFIALGEAYSDYATGLSSISKGNPEWFTSRIKNARARLKDIIDAGTSPRAKLDHAAAGIVESLKPTVDVIFAEIKEGKAIKEALGVRSLPIDVADQILETLTNVREKIEKTKDRFEGIIEFFIKLNFGEELNYVKRLREDFQKIQVEQKKRYDEIINGTLKGLIRDYKFRTREVIRRMKLVAEAAKLPGEETRNSIEEERQEIDMLERTLEPTLSKVLSLSFEELQKDGFIREIQPHLEESHQQFDKWVRAAILQLISDYSATAGDISGALDAMIDVGKLDSGLEEQFKQARADLDSLGFAISEIIDLSYNVRRAEFTDQISLAQSNQRRRFDRLVRNGIVSLIRDYDFKNNAIVKGIEPLIEAAKVLGTTAVEEIVQAKADINSLDALFDSVVGQILNTSYDVKRGEFTELISEVQAKRKRDFNDQVRLATKKILDYAGRARVELRDDLKAVQDRAESAMIEGDYQESSRLYEIASRIASELKLEEQSKELLKRSKSMKRLIL
ncbi:MAG: hypothetical protein ACOC4M_06825 [Promethearchaeia archaeon]